MASLDRYPRLTLVTGPTGAGKSRIAESMAVQSGSPIVVLDRFQVFPGLRVGTGRQSPLAGTGFQMHFLEHRSVSAGELFPTQALGLLRDILSSLGQTMPEAIIEGGSTSLLKLVMADAGIRAVIDRIEVLDLSPPSHSTAIVDRARRMLVSDGDSMIDEADRVWQSAESWRFVSKICGYDAIAGLCEELGCRPRALTSEMILRDLLSRIADAHLAYAERQREVFRRLFPGLDPMLVNASGVA